MTDSILSLARAALEDDAKVTPGPWFCSPCGNPMVEGQPCWCAIVDRGPDDKWGIVPAGSIDVATASFIVAARSREPLLAEAVIRLHKALSDALDLAEEGWNHAATRIGRDDDSGYLQDRREYLTRLSELRKLASVSR